MPHTIPLKLKASGGSMTNTWGTFGIFIQELHKTIQSFEGFPKKVTRNFLVSSNGSGWRETLK